MKTLATFYDLILPELPGGPTLPLVNLHLVLVARDFCERTRAWRADFDAITTSADQAAYDVDPSEPQSELVMVHKLSLDDAVLFDDAWMPGDASDEPEYTRDQPPFTLSDDLLTLTLADDEVPTAAGTLQLRGSMKPKQGATQLPDMLYTVHSAAMRSGVLAAFMSMAGKPWSAPGQGQLYRSDFESRIQHAATNARMGNTRRLLRTRPWG